MLKAIFFFLALASVFYSASPSLALENPPVEMCPHLGANGDKLKNWLYTVTMINPAAAKQGLCVLIGKCKETTQEEFAKEWWDNYYARNAKIDADKVPCHPVKPEGVSISTEKPKSILTHSPVMSFPDQELPGIKLFRSLAEKLRD